MQCWKCANEIGMDSEKIGFRAECPHCAAWIHCCRACEFYNVLVSQSCEIPTIDYVGDKETRNLCEHFRPAPKLIAAVSGNRSNAADARTSSEEARKRFDDLFR